MKIRRAQGSGLLYGWKSGLHKVPGHLRSGKPEPTVGPGISREVTHTQQLRAPEESKEGTSTKVVSVSRSLIGQLVRSFSQQAVQLIKYVHPYKFLLNYRNFLDRISGSQVLGICHSKILVPIFVFQSYFV
jgi:hypothetical protein